MNLLNILRHAEPFCGDWYIKSYVERRGCFDIYIVKNRLEHIAEMKVLVLPEGKNVGDFFEVLKKVSAAGKDNENITEIYGYGSEKSDDNRWVIYIICEKAEPIEEYLKKTRMSSGVITSIVCDIASALCACEAQGIYHGDISYKNIYFCGSKYKLGCFGEAELLSHAGMSDKDNTNYCIAPERQDGKGDIRSDFYSLGIIVYGMYNFGRLPFVPSKNERFILTDNAEKTAFDKRMKDDNSVFPNPMYAEPPVIEFINRCCAFAPENRFASAEQLAEAAEHINKSIDYGKTIEYPNFQAEDVKRRQETEDMDVYYDKSERETEGREISENSYIREEEDDNNFTMGAHEIYTETMSRIRNNRHRQVDESVLQEIEETEQKLAKKYGVDSPQYKKFIEKVQAYEKLQDSVTGLKKGNKKRTTVIKILIGAAAAAVIAGVVLALNTNTFYINQGQYDRIYRRNLLGSVECFKSVSCDSLLKDGGRLYYIKSENGKIYSTSARKGDDEILITDDSAAEFKIVDGYIYYINNSDGQKLYRITTDGENRGVISDEACISIAVDKKNIEFINASSTEEPKLFDTKSGIIKDEYIN